MAKKYSKSYLNTMKEWYEDMAQWVEHVYDNAVVSIYIAGHQVKIIKNKEDDRLIDGMEVHIKYKFEELGSSVLDYLQSQFGAKSYLITHVPGEWRITFYLDNYNDTYHIQLRTGQWIPIWRKKEMKKKEKNG